MWMYPRMWSGLFETDAGDPNLIGQWSWFFIWLVLPIIMTLDFFDYIHLLKIDEKWKIINVLWDME